jgi:pyruvate,water dikinase
MPPIPSLRQILYRVLFPDRLTRRKYISFKALLEEDHRCHQLMAQIERIHSEGTMVDFSAIRSECHHLIHALENMLRHLDHMAPRVYRPLQDAFARLNAALEQDLRPASLEGPYTLAINVSDIPPDAEQIVGGKAAHLGRIARDLGLRLPRGMVVTARAFHRFLEANNLRGPIQEILASVRLDDPAHLEQASKALIRLIMESPLPPEIIAAIEDRLNHLEGLIYRDSEPGSSEAGEETGGRATPSRVVRWAVRSSAVGEDSSLSFAGQYRSILNVDTASVASSYREVLASKYAPRALVYRISHGLLDEETPMAVLVMEMIEATASGVVYSVDPGAHESESIMVYSTWGMGEALVSGEASPDLFQVTRKPPRRIARHEQHSMDSKLTPGEDGELESVPLDPSERDSPSLGDGSVLQLADWAMLLENLFASPQDLEWCADRHGTLFLLQSRPLETAPGLAERCEVQISDVAPLLLSGGQTAAGGTAGGRVVKVTSLSELQQIPDRTVLVAERPSPELSRLLGKLSAVVTERGSAAGHFASIARRHSIPTIVNLPKATRALESGDEVIVDATRCRIYRGSLEELASRRCEVARDTAQTPVMKRLARILNHVSPLHLTSPESPHFTASNCQTLHDILRFAHEKAIMEMFSLGEERGARTRGTRKLRSDLPITLYLLDIGDSIDAERAGGMDITIEAVKSRPLQALWRGLSHPGLNWASRPQPVDLGAMEQVTAGGGIIGLDSGILASFAIVSQDYMNINIRFGFHFVVVDTLCGPTTSDNYISFRFEGGGGVLEGRRLRARLLVKALEISGFETAAEQDVIVARAREQESDAIQRRLSILGRLLAFTPLMDMEMHDPDDVDRLVSEFMEMDENSDD